MQRQVTAALQVDTAHINKMEHNEKPISHNHLKKFSSLYGVPENELLPIWLADKILLLMNNKKYKVQDLELALSKVKENWPN